MRTAECSKAIAKQVLPSVLGKPAYASISRAYRAARGRWDRDDPLFDADAELGPLVTDVFDRVRNVDGYFNYDDCVAFTLILKTQSLAGVRGDMIEIGSYHGRSTLVLAQNLCLSEELLVCDTFELPAGDKYPNPPSVEGLRRTLSSLPGLRPEAVDIQVCHSADLELQPDRRFRFAHIDGGHAFGVALGDMSMVAPLLTDGGIMAVDDYKHPLWPDVTRAVDTFLSTHGDFDVMADVNRWAEPARKIYISRK